MGAQSTLADKDAPDRQRTRGFQLMVMANDQFALYPLPSRGVVVLGRGADADVRVDDPRVSRRHAQIHVGEALEVEDLAGINGTFLGGRRLATGERAGLAPGEVIGIGEVIAVVQPRQGRLATGPRFDSLDPEGASALQQIPTNIVIADDHMRRIYALAARAARSPINILVLGDTGVGKELLAQTIHACSQRGLGPLVCLDCSTFSETLLASELFGHERGAFTGAQQAKPGLLETANGGTVFLDEVGEIAPAIQAQLLRVMETQEVRRVGSLKPRSIDVRFVAATNKDLAAEVQRGGFRRDLYYRLNGLTLHLPPLHERPAEIRLLAERFVTVACKRAKREREPGLTTGALARLQQHNWPGNVRELRNAIELAVTLCGAGPIEEKHLILGGIAPAGSAIPAPPSPVPAAAKANLKEEVAVLARQRIVDALDECGGNQTRAAKALGISRRTLLKRLDAYGLIRPRKGR